MMRFRLKFLVILVLCLVLTTSIIATVNAAGIKQKIDAWFGWNNITYNGQDVTGEVESVIIDGKTYILLRDIADLFHKSVEWLQETQTVAITDNSDISESEFESRLNEKDERISELEKDIEYYKLYDIDEMEKKIEEDYKDYRDVSFDISLDGDMKNVAVKIKVDRNDWNDLRDNYRLSYLQEICDSIREVYKKADITGYLKNDSSSSSKKLNYFYTDDEGNVKLQSGDKSIAVVNLENKMEVDYNKYFSGVELEIDLEGDEKEVEYTVNVDLEEYGAKWDDLTDLSVKTLMEKIYDDILKEFDDCDTEGYVYDIDEKEIIATYKRTSNGQPEFIRE